MTKQEAYSKIQDTVKAYSDYGFTAGINDFTGYFEIKEADDLHTVNFTIKENSVANWKEHEAFTTIAVQASIASMGGQPTTNELLTAAHRIEGAARLAERLTSMKITYKETW